MPDGEITVVSLCVHHVSAVVRWPGPRHALASQPCIDQRVDSCSQSARSLIESHTTQTVALLVVLMGIVLAQGGGEIEPFTIGREGRSVLCPLLFHDERVVQYLMFLGVIDKDIRGSVVHLNALVVGCVEHLCRFVGRECTVTAAGMPVGIDHRTA